MAEGLMRHDLNVRGIESDVSSVGTLEVSSGADPFAVQILAEQGIDISGHRSRMMTEKDLAGVDLVIGMAPEHVRAVALLDPSVFARTFTLREIVRRAQASGGPTASEPVWQWGTRLSADRRFTDLLGDAPADSIADPIGRPLAFFRGVADQIAELTSALAVTMAARRLSGGDSSLVD
jgi:protein-tyrosine-phosphatase